MAGAMYGMRPRSLNSDETREKEAGHQPLASANEQEKLWGRDGNNLAHSRQVGPKA